MTKTAEQASALEGLTSGLHEREMSTLFTYQTLHKQRKTNKQINTPIKGGHMSLDFCVALRSYSEKMWTSRTFTLTAVLIMCVCMCVCVYVQYVFIHIVGCVYLCIGLF